MSYTKLAEHDELRECINNNESVIIYYGAEWCRSCVTGTPVFEAISNMEEYAKIKFYKVDIDKIPETKESQDIVSIPLIIGYIKGKEVARTVGISTNHLVEIIEQCIVSEEEEND